MQKIEEALLEKPKCFNPYDPGSVLMNSEESFENICTTLQENGIVDPKGLSEYEFYSKLKFYEKKYKKNGNS
jgi:hypothetical protein